MSMRIKVGARVASCAGSARKPGKLTMVNSGVNSSVVLSSSLMNIVRANSECHVEFGDDADGQPVARVGSGESVLHEEVAALRVSHHAVAQGVELLLRKFFVDLAPEDLVIARRLAHDGFIFGRASGVLARVDEQRAVRRE